MFAELTRDQERTGVEATALPHIPAVDGAAWPSDIAVWSGGDFSDAAVGTDPAGVAQEAGGDRSAAGSHADMGGGRSELKTLSHSALQDRVVGLVAERNRVEGEYLAALGELTSRYGPQAAAYVLRDQTRMNGAQARAESRLADSLREHDFCDTVDAMRSGEIHMAHAKVIARESPKQHRRSEESFLGLARAYPSDTIARHTLAYESEQVYADLAAEAEAGDLSPVDAELALQRLQRRASMRCGDDGMWDLSGRFDFLTGRQLSIALQAAVRSARRNADKARNGAGDAAVTAAGGAAASDAGSGDPAAGGAVGAGAAEPTTAQLTADALAELICGTERTRRAHAGLMLVADYDVVNDRLANPRLDDGTPVSPKMLADLTLEPLPASAPRIAPGAARGHRGCQGSPPERPADQTAEYAVAAKVLPAVFSADWSQLALGRTRNASDAQRLILALRDGGCIGCELTAEHTEAHHIAHHEHGGPTDIPNLASLCRPCHKDLHNHQRQIDTPADGRPRLRPPEPTGTDPLQRDGADPPSPNGSISTNEPSRQRETARGP